MSGTARVSMFGMSESGKAVVLWNRFVSLHKRVLVVDALGEWTEKPVKGERVDGLNETLWAIDHSVRTGGQFRIFANLNEEEVSKLARILIPDKAYENSPVIAMGGLALYLPEVDMQIEPHTYDRVRDLWRRGRHVGLSVYADTQSLSSCSKEVIKNVHILGMTATTHDNDLDVLAKQIRDDATFQRAYNWTLKPYHCALWWPTKRALTLLPPCSPVLAP